MLDKIKLWILGISPLKKVIDFLDGKKQAIASLAAALTASGTILAKYLEQGNAYILHVASTPEFVAASAGWIGFFNALKGEKIRAEIAEAKAATPNP